MPIRDTLAALVAGARLTPDQAREFFENLLAGSLDDAQIGAALALIQQRGPSIDELTEGARVMRNHVTAIPGISEVPGTTPHITIDTCGTGGAAKTFNISTISAIVTAASAPGRVRVAKHGNKGRSGRGSAEVIAALGVNTSATPETQARSLREAGVCFCFAVNHHPAMKHAAKARQSLGFPTIFNLLGPLTNPARVRHQVMGVYSPEYVDLIAHVLARLGCERAMVVHGLEGLDEISTVGPTRVAHVERGNVRIETLSPESFGMAPTTLAALGASDLQDAVRIAHAVLANHPGPALDIVLVNAGAALCVGAAASTIKDGIELARSAVRSGAAARTLESLVRISNEPAA